MVDSDGIVYVRCMDVCWFVIVVSFLCNDEIIFQFILVFW